MDWKLHSVISNEALQTLERLASSCPKGDFVEVGVYRGGSAERLYEIAQRQKRKLHLFDTFEGMPTQGPLDELEVGSFSDTSLPELRKYLPNALFYKGIFPNTMPRWLGPLAFVHVDCDQYDGVKASIERLFPLLVHGGIMLFDDWRVLTGASVAIYEIFGEKLQETPENKAFVVKGSL